MQVQVISGNAAADLMRDQAFVQSWHMLVSVCPWSTPFQSIDFARTWYGTYEELYSPVLVLGKGNDDRLDGLLLLALDNTSAALIHVGGHHAEYHAWLAREDTSSGFITAALSALANAYPRAGLLRFLFLSKGTPTSWISSPPWIGRADLRPHRRPLMAVGPASACEQTLRKKKYRYRLKRLSQAGTIKFEQMHTRQELEDVIDSIIDYCDLRQAAVHGSTPFRSDPYKRELYLRLMDAPGLMHASVMRVGDDVVSVHVGARTSTSVSLGLYAYTPFLAAHSLGTLHILLLGRMLADQGYTELDLTPGGEYKERFASHHDTVYVLDVFFQRSGRWKQKGRQQLVRAGRQFLQMTKIGEERVREQAGLLMERLLALPLSTVPRRAARLIATRVFSGDEFRVYRLKRCDIPLFEGVDFLNRNSISDLLCYMPEGTDRPDRTTRARSRFLREALRRLEEGQVVYTYAKNGLLLHYSWLIPKTNRGGSERGHVLKLPENSAVIWDAFTHPSARGQGLQKIAHRTALADVARTGEAEYVIVGVRASNGPSRHNIEKLGFTYWYSVRSWYRFGRLIRGPVPEEARPDAA